MRQLIIVSLLFLLPSFILAETVDMLMQADTKKIEQSPTHEFDAFEDEFADEFGDKNQPERYDPLSGYNRLMTDFNDGFYTYLLFPVVKGYRYVAPEPAREGISRFFDNLFFPVRFVNNVLQGKVTNATEELGRFVINSTIGFLGFFDPAQENYNLIPHKEDFGQTLGYYGMGGGFHIVLPIFGPSNLRDTVGMIPDWYIDPLVYHDNRGYNLLANSQESSYVKGGATINRRTFDVDLYESLKKDAIDFYPMLREAYEQNREKAILE